MLTKKQQEQLRQIPAIHELLQQERIVDLVQEAALDGERITKMCRESAAEVRRAILEDHADLGPEVTLEIVRRVEEKAKHLLFSPLQPLINGTGVVLHTNLGRAKLSEAAEQAMTQVARSFSSLEFELSTGERGSRHAIVEELICALTGAEAALVCNNNAAAVYLVLKSLAKNREVIVSRGELVEIGGSFRVSEIMKESGAALVEVGTTNKTHLHDYEQAISDHTALIMKVHTSNFVIKGFTTAVPGAALTKLAHQHGLLVFEDLGSGVLYDLRAHGIGEEPTVQEVLRDGIDLVSFSGDKLLGGPQAGIIAGKKNLIERLKKSQLMRTLRVDKFTLAALHATLAAYLDENRARTEIPTLRMILAQKQEIKRRVDLFLDQFHSDRYVCRAIEVESEVGGGTLPDVRLPSWGVELTASSGHYTPVRLSTRLRQVTHPVIGRIHKERFILDFRTIDTEDIPRLIHSLKEGLS
jgi:L-seryl-tRNA(Ser) seleniumtransferase